jgi:hypothetical protein
MRLAALGLFGSAHSFFMKEETFFFLGALLFCAGALEFKPEWGKMLLVPVSASGR